MFATEMLSTFITWGNVIIEAYYQTSETRKTDFLFDLDVLRRCTMCWYLSAAMATRVANMAAPHASDKTICQFVVNALHFHS